MDRTTLNKVIAEHMFRSGNYTAGEAFTQEAKIAMPENFKDQFVMLNQILVELKERKVETALKWAKAKQKELEQQGSDLLF